MQFFKQLTDPALKRLYKFVLKRLIGRFLAEDEIDLDQLDVHLRSGRLELCDLLLNADVLNAEICEANGLPFRVKKGYLGSVRVTISYTNIMSESCLVEIDDIEIVLVPVGEAETEESSSTSNNGLAAKGGAAGSGKSNADTKQQTAVAKPRANSREQIDEVSQEGLDFVASWIEQVTSKIKVTLSNICLRLETGDPTHGKNVALLCKLEWAQFTDESASEVASVYAGGGSTGASQQSMYQSMAASSLFGISQKAVKFRGISMDLLLPSDDVEEDDSGSELHHFLASDSTRQCYVQVKLSHYEALDAPSIDADLFLHSIRVVLQPQHFSHFGTLLDAFSDDIPAPSAKDRYTTSSSMYASVCDTRPAWLNEDDQESHAAEAGAQLSLREFQRIELLLQQYHKTHEDLKSAQRERLRDRGSSYEQADFAYPVPRKLSIAESVESVGLSDLEDDDAFFECDTGAESLLANSRYGGASDLMAQSMYASALYDHAETESSSGGGGAASASLRASVRRGSSRNVRNRVKLHLLECEIVILYDDLPDHDTDDEDDGEDHSSESRRQRQLRRRRRGLPTITDQERLEISVKDVILSTLVYPSHVAISVSVGTFEIVERMLARMSTDVADDGDALLRTTILRFADVSPATGRKVHLSANLSAQFRLDLKPDGSVESLALQVSAQPILLEWDMHIIDRAHRLMTLMEESSAAAQKKKSMTKPSATAVLDYPKKLDVNTECVEITLRFPMVSSDLIRFGPSAKRGLSEDKLVLLLEGVKASSYEHTSDVELPPTKVPLPWLAEFDVNFDSVNAWLVGPLCGDQRSRAVDKLTILSGRSDATSGDKCGLRIRLQVPTNDEVRSALTAKHNLSQDSLENHIEASASNSPDTEEKSGDDNDGGRVGSNGWSQDARSRAHAFEGAARAAALVDLEILIPHSTVVFDKRSFDRLMILFDALLMINPIDVNGHNQMMATSAYRNRLVPSYMSMEVTLKDGTIELQYAPPPTATAPSPSTAFIYHLAFQDLRIFQVSQWMGQLVSRVHVAAQNMTLLEEDCKSKVTSPVLYKNPIGVNEAPILFVGMDIIDQTQEMREMKVELHVSQVNLRHEVSSLWMVYLAELLLLEYPPPIIPLDSASTNEEEYKEILEQIEAATYEAVKLAIAPKTVFTKLFVSFYDAMIDYAPTTLSSRVMVVLGNVSVSSNVVTGALIQGYKIAVKDVQLYLTPERPSYEEIDECILGSELFLTTNNAKRRAMVSFAGESRSRGQLSGLYPSLLVFFEKHGFLLMVTMDFIDVFLRAIVPPVEPRGPLLTGEPEVKVTPASLGAPELSVELNMGTANIYACFDSFNTLIELISTWSDQLSVEAEPRDTTGYVGLDRVKDVSSVSVVTNLGPATVRSSRPSMDDSFSPPLANGRMDRASSRSSMQTTRASSTYSDRDSFSSSLRQDVANGGRSGLNLFSQLDENAFGGGGERVYSGAQATTDTEARLLRTRLDEIQKEKNRIVSGASSVGGDYDDSLSATELRRKYKQQDDVPSKPKIRINELVIDDYYAGNRAGTSYGDDQPVDAGGFLLAAESEPVEPKSTVADSPWFASPPDASFQPAFPAGSHPVGSLPEEHSARWLSPSSMGGSPRPSSTTSSPRFDPVEEESPARELGSLDRLTLNAHTDDYDENDEEDEYPLGAFPAGPKRWWGMQAQSDFELSELQTEETESSFSHQLPFMDDESAQAGEEQPVNPMSMSMMCTGEDEGTEVELDFTLDREMQSTFNRLMDSDDGHGDGMEDEDSDEESEAGAESASGPGSPYHYQATTMTSPRMRSFHQEMSVPRSIPPRRTSFSDQSSQSGAPSTAGPAIISPPDEPTARWFYDDVAGSDTYSREGPPSRIYPHHVEIPIGGTAASLSFGEKECDEAIRSVAREKAAMKLPASAPVVIRHVLLRDFNICMRFFGGSDWSRDLVNVPTLSRNRHQATAVSNENKSAPTATKDNKEKLLDALLDNYVSSSGSDLFGGDSSETPLFSDKPASVPARSTMSDRLSPAKPPTSAATRKRSLKSGRKTEEMLELVVTRIQLRLDMFNDDDAQPLASNTVIALGDIEILDYISTSQIRKIICYWKSETSHPRESSSSMVHVHLMTVRPGRNLCEEHRLKVRILPLRVNLDQEVVSFLRQFVPTEAGTRSASMSFPPGAIPEDVEDGDDDDDDGTGGYDGTELSAMNVATPSRVTETDVSLGSWFFQSIEIRPCKIKIDYRPNRVDFQALRAGDYLEVINLFVLEGMELVLRRVKASGIDGWAGLGEHVLMSWVNDISRHQIHKCVASVSMPPLRSFANIGSGAADLILLPLEHYGRDRRVVRGLKKGAQSFLKSVTIETLNTASKMAQGTQALLEHADDVVSSAASRKKSIKYRQPGSRIARNSKRMGGGGIRSAQDRGGIGSRQYLAQQPSNATEGFYQAYDSLSRELQHAAKTIVAVPLVEYKKTGSGGYVRSVIRAVPVAVLRPMIGATEAMSKALIGVRNAVDPEMKEDVENKFKDFRTI